MRVREALNRYQGNTLATKLVAISTGGTTYVFDSVQDLLNDMGNYIKDCAYKSGYIQPDLFGIDQVLYIYFDVKE